MSKLCTKPECTNPLRAKGLCESHYRQSRRAKPERVCAVLDCDKSIIAYELCSNHYAVGKRKSIKQPDICIYPGCSDYKTEIPICEKHSRHYINNKPERTSDRKCSVGGCGKKHYGKGLCHKHYERLPESRDRRAAYVEKNLNKIRNKNKECSRKYRENFPEKVKESLKNWREKNKDRVREYAREYVRRKMKEDINYKLRANLRKRPHEAVSRGYKNCSAVGDLGCSIDELKAYLALRFTEGMSWDNYGDWHIDHIIALAHFDLNDPVQSKAACHYTNLQPLWAIDNLRKNKY